MNSFEPNLDYVEGKAENKFSRNYFRNNKAKTNSFKPNMDNQLTSKPIMADRQNEELPAENGFFQNQ